MFEGSTHDSCSVRNLGFSVPGVRPHSRLRGEFGKGSGAGMRPEMSAMIATVACEDNASLSQLFRVTPHRLRQQYQLAIVAYGRQGFAIRWLVA